MPIVTQDPLVSRGLLWSPRKDALTYTVICKLTLDVCPGEMRLSDQPTPIVETDVYWNDDELKSLLEPSDIAPTKPMVDVILGGHAFAPAGKPVSSLVCRLRISDLDKQVEVVGDRVWLDDGRLQEATPFVQMPLRYERAAFGRDNPVGLRHERDARGSIVLPNLQPVGTSIDSPKSSIAPIGFGPIAPIWPVRMIHGRLLPPDWMKQTQVLSFPVNFDLTYFQVAPADQRLAILHPDEDLELENLHPEIPHLKTRLPGYVPRVIAEFSADKREQLMMRSDTLRIDTDLKKCVVTFRGHVNLRPGQELPLINVSLETPRAPTRHGRHNTLKIVETTPLERATRTTSIPPADVANPALPFSQPNSSQPVVLQPQDPPPTSVSDDLSATAFLPVLRVTPAALPFANKDTPAESRPNFPPPPPMGLVPLKSSLGSTFGELEIERQEYEAKWEKNGPKPNGTVNKDEPAPKMSGRAVVKPMTKKYASVTSVSKPEMLGIIPPPVSVETSPKPKQEELSLILPRATVAVELLHFDPERVDDVRAQPSWKNIVSAIRPKPRDADSKSDAPDDKKKDAKNRRELTGILARGDVTSGDELRRVLDEAVDEDGTFVPPLVLLSGELVFLFDEMEALKATLAAVTPFAHTDKRLKEIIDVAREAMQTPWLQGAGHVVENMTAQVRDIFGETKRGLPSGYLAAHTERILLAQRHYQKRTVLGRRWMRAFFTSPSGSLAIPTYLPPTLAEELPMYTRLPVRMIAEVRWQLDQAESSPHALRVVTLGRTLLQPGIG